MSVPLTTSEQSERTNTNALIVFAKIPVPGQVKTRLTAILTPEEAARLYTAFLQDALIQYSALPVEVLLFLGPSENPVPQGFWPDTVQVYTQKGKGLGERMSNAFDAAFTAGYDRAVVIGTDHPTLPSAYILSAFDFMKQPDRLVIGPSNDGGYYLLGMNMPYPVLFADMTYSHADVFAQTRTRMAQTGAAVRILPEWYDVDTPADLKHLLQNLEATPVPLPHTRRIATTIRRRYPALC